MPKATKCLRLKCISLFSKIASGVLSVCSSIFIRGVTFLVKTKWSAASPQKEEGAPLCFNEVLTLSNKVRLPVYECILLVVIGGGSFMYEFFSVSQFLECF